MSAQPAVSNSHSQQVEERRRGATRVLYSAAAAVAISAMLPWVSVEGILNAHLSGGGLLFIVILAAGYAGAGWLTQSDRPSRTSQTIAWVINGLLGLVVVAVYSKLGATEGVAGPAIGVFAAAFGVILGVVGALKLGRAGK
jgi:hypothetical protein